MWYQGSNDESFTPADLELAARLGVETHLIPDADHVASFRQADKVLKVVRPLLERHGTLASSL
ncbi:MAG: pimeloyl-ACP methyl ester carboxylesterase [Candidatus Poriferisodalaceae bacterium]